MSDLKPAGYILVDEQIHPAISQSGYINKGEEVQIIAGEEQTLKVKKKES